jgi:DNA-binding HxlR family transcriptional regulator
MTGRTSRPKKLGSEAVLELFVSKWAIKIVHALTGGARRHGELKKQLGSVSQKMLTQTLRDLEIAGLVQRTVHLTIPPKVEYSLTPLGHSFVEPLNALCQWAQDHREELESVGARKKAPIPKPATTLEKLSRAPGTTRIQ